MTRNGPPSLLPFRWALILPAVFLLAACSAGQAGPTSWPNVSAGDSVAFVAKGPAVHAIDLNSGAERWRFPQTPDTKRSFYAAPAVAEDGVIYAGGYDGSVHALDADTGAPLPEWQPSPLQGRVIGSPAIAGDLVLVPSDGGKLYALERGSGRLVWAFDAGGPLWSAPRVDGDTVFVASLAHRVFGVNLANGQKVWETDLGFAIADTPTLQNGSLLVGTLGDSLVALDTRNGQEAWRAPTAGWQWGSPAIGDSTAYFGDVTGSVYALDLSTGQQVWVDPAGGAITSSPVIAEGLLIVAFQDDRVAAYDLEKGTVAWQATTAGPIQADPVVAGGKVVVAVNNNETLLQAFDLKTGAPVWNFQPAPAG